MKKLFFIFTLFLLVISCGNEEENSTTKNGLVTQKSVEKNNLNNIKTRIANSVLKFRQKEQYFVGKNPRLGFLINFKDEKLNLLFAKNKKEAFSLSFLSIERGNETKTTKYLRTVLGKCSNPNRVDTDLKCLQRVEIQRENLTEWFENKHNSIEHGFDIFKKPQGFGKIKITLNLENATALKKDNYILIKQGKKTVAKYSKLKIKDKKGKTITGTLNAKNNEIILSFDDSKLIYPIEIDPTITVTETENKKLTASDGAEDDEFGYSVSISGDFAIVGAYWDDDNGENSGSAYIFSKDFGGANNWGKVKKLTASDGAKDDHFGTSVSISGDFAIVGAYGDDDNGSDSGSAYIFSKANNWGKVKKLTASDGAQGDEFGISVSISSDFAIVAAPYDNNNLGSAYIFKIKKEQTITFNPIPTKTYGDSDFDLIVTTSSGLPLSFTSSNTNVATVSGPTVTIVGAGTTTITVSQSGNDYYLPALLKLKINQLRIIVIYTN